MTTPLISFPAGRALRVGETSRVEAEADRGLLYITEEEGLVHFCWTNSNSDNPNEDLIIFPGDASFAAVPQSPRTFVLKFASSSARHFYWAQDLDASQDAQRVARINELIQAQDEAADDVDMDASTAAAPAPQPADAQRQQQTELANILASFRQQDTHPPAADLTLPDLLAPLSAITPLANDASVQEALYPYFPAGIDPTPDNLRRILSSVELRKSLSGLDHALRTGALGPLVASLGLDDSAAIGVEEFLQAVQRKADQEKGGQMQTD